LRTSIFMISAVLWVVKGGSIVLACGVGIGPQQRRQNQ
jgi:hypothetical protein